MGLYVFRPLDEAVGRVREVTELEDEEDVLTGEDIYDALENRGDEPRDPLLAVSQQDEHTVRDTDRGRAGVEVADDILERVVPTEEVGRDVESGEEPADDNSPDDDACDDEERRETGELPDLCEVFFLLVGVTVPVDEADYVDRKPEEDGRRHGREAVGEQDADEYLGELHKDRDDIVSWSSNDGLRHLTWIRAVRKRREKIRETHIFSYFCGRDSWTRTNEMQESKSCALTDLAISLCVLKYYTIFSSACQGLSK